MVVGAAGNVAPEEAAAGEGVAGGGDGAPEEEPIEGAAGMPWASDGAVSAGLCAGDRSNQINKAATKRPRPIAAR